MEEHARLAPIALDGAIRDPAAQRLLLDLQRVVDKVASIEFWRVMRRIGTGGVGITRSGSTAEA